MDLSRRLLLFSTSAILTMKVLGCRATAAPPSTIL
jgi:hypothetical protein